MKPFNEASYSGKVGPATFTDTHKPMNIYTEIEGGRTPFSTWPELFLTLIMAANGVESGILNYCLEETLLTDVKNGASGTNQTHIFAPL